MSDKAKTYHIYFLRKTLWKHWASQCWVSVINLAYLWQKIFSVCPNIYRTDFVFFINKNVTVNIESNCYITQCTHPRCKFFWNIFLQYSLEASMVTARKIFVIKNKEVHFKSVHNIYPSIHPTPKLLLSISLMYVYYMYSTTANRLNLFGGTEVVTSVLL